MKKIVFIIMTIFSSIFGMSAQQSDQITVLEVIDFKKEITTKGVQLIDVRTAEEYNSGHIKNAINIDIYNRDAFTASVKELDEEQPVFLYCRSGSRSRSASKLLVELGFKKIYDLKGGYINWQNN
jgi:rhodanese-related sulfurtransferase